MTTEQVTIFGGTGFIGRHLVAALTGAGWSVRVAGRNPVATAVPDPARGAQVAFIEADVRDHEQVRRAVADSAAVVNLVGRLTGSEGELYALHRDAAAAIASAATRAGASALVHVSALGADAGAPAAADRSKAAGEAAVRAAYPAAAVVRPSLVFGVDDHFFNRMADMARRLPFVPLLGDGETRVQPVAVEDLVAALRRILEDRALRPGTYEIGGPEVYSLRQLVEMTQEAVGRARRTLALPYPLAGSAGAVLQHLPGAPFTADQVDLMKTDKVVGEGAAGLPALGIEARHLAPRLARLGTPARPVQ